MLTFLPVKILQFPFWLSFFWRLYFHKSRTHTKIPTLTDKSKKCSRRENNKTASLIKKLRWWILKMYSIWFIYLSHKYAVIKICFKILTPLFVFLLLRLLILYYWQERQRLPFRKCKIFVSKSTIKWFIYLVFWLFSPAYDIHRYFTFLTITIFIS